MASDPLAKLERDMAVGVLHLLLLAYIGRDGPVHGYGLIKAMEGATASGLAFKPGTIYPILNDLEAAGLVRSAWGEAASGPQRKYYQLTARGRNFLDTASEKWGHLRDAVDAALDGRPTR